MVIFLFSDSVVSLISRNYNEKSFYFYFFVGPERDLLGLEQKMRRGCSRAQSVQFLGTFGRLQK